MSKLLTGKKALVTGGTRGIGFAIAERLAAEGASVTVTGTKTPSSTIPFPVEVVNFSDRADLQRFLEKFSQSSYDILINNAGINKIGFAETIDPKDFDEIQDVNVRAPFLLIQAALPSMKLKNWGRIVNVGSIFGIISKEKRVSYSVSKSALSGMTKTIAIEGAASGILVNCVAPGFIDTELTQRVLGEVGMKELANQVPMKRMGNAAEIANFVTWLSSTENTFLTGQTIAIDGGFTCV